MTNRIYQAGDKVRVLKARFVRRVGYPLVWYEVEDVQLYADPRIGTALRALGLHPAEMDGLTSVHDEIPRHLQRAFAMEWVAQQGFGGNARTIHYWDGKSPPNVLDPIWRDYYGVGTEHVVLSKRHVKTGTRFAGAWHGYGEDEDYTPGGLDDMRVHTLLKLSGEVEIEACNVELA